MLNDDPPYLMPDSSSRLSALLGEHYNVQQRVIIYFAGCKD